MATRRRRTLILCTALLTAGLALGGGLARPLHTDALLTSRQTVSASIQTTAWSPLPATVEIEPESLQRRNEGEPVLARVTLPAGFDVRDIAVEGVRLCLGPDPCIEGVRTVGVGTIDGRALRLTFPRAEVIALVAGEPAPSTVTLTVSGRVDPSGRAFAGSDTVRLLGPAPTPTLVPGPLLGGSGQPREDGESGPAVPVGRPGEGSAPPRPGGPGEGGSKAQPAPGSPAAPPGSSGGKAPAPSGGPAPAPPAAPVAPGGHGQS